MSNVASKKVHSSASQQIKETNPKKEAKLKGSAAKKAKKF